MRDMCVTKAMQGDLDDIHDFDEIGERLCQGSGPQRPNSAVTVDPQKYHAVITGTDAKF